VPEARTLAHEYGHAYVGQFDSAFDHDVAKSEAARANGRKGGRPRKPRPVREVPVVERDRQPSSR
jgi:hypothetical protein